MAYATFNKPSLHFDVNTYDATGSAKTITGMNFKPDLIFTKNRSNASYIHAIVDAVRGGTNKLFTSNSNAQSADAQAVTAFTSDGYTFGTSGSFNNGTDPYVNWCWKAGNSAGSANNDGTTTSTVSVNTAAGISIIKYTGNAGTNSVGHGLGVKPDFFITKGLSSSHGWVGWHRDLVGSNEVDRYIYLNSANAAGTQTGGGGYWAGGGGITTSTIGLWTSGGDNNANGIDYIMYAFAEKKGFSKFTRWVGNGNDDGAFVYCGFRPAFVLMKAYDTASRNWTIADSKRDGYNPDNDRIHPNVASDSENAADVIELHTNGFRFISDEVDNNQNGVSYLCAAFAEMPTVANVGVNGVPALAR